MLDMCHVINNYPSQQSYSVKVTLDLDKHTDDKFTMSLNKKCLTERLGEVSQKHHPTLFS